MTRILFVGQAPDTVDFSDPALPPGMDVDKIQAGIDLAMKQMRERGWEADFCSVQPDDSAAPTLAAMLAAKAYDCVVIGAGLRLPPTSLPLFETLVNVIYRSSPAAAIAFNTRPEDTADVAERRLAASREGGGR
jgi:hypothetical protein